MSLATTIGDQSLNSCLSNASGCWCRLKTELDELQLSKCSMIVSKSSTILKREGNPHPRFYMDQNGSINSMGLPNEGFDFYLNYGKSPTLSKIYCQSIYPFSLNELTFNLLRSS